MAKILIVDGAKNLRRLYRRYFEIDGHLVTTAGTAAEALRLSDADRPDLVVMDACLPDMDGLDLIARLLHRDPKTAFVLNSACPAHLDGFPNRAADARLTKSSDIRELRDAVSTILESRRPSATASVG